MYGCLRVFVRSVFVFPFCAYFLAKAEISWLGTIRGDSECKAELFLFVSDISTLRRERFRVFHVFGHPADLSPEKCCQVFVLIAARQ